MAKTNNNVPSFLGAQQGNVETSPSGPRFKVAQWFNGALSAKGYGVDDPRYTGGFFFKHKQASDFPLGNEIDYTFANGEEETLLGIGGAPIIVLSAWVDWYIGDKDNPTWLPNYQQGARGRNRAVIMFVDALDWHAANGPLLLSFWSKVNGMLFSRALKEFNTKIHRPAEGLVNMQLDAYTFAVPIVPGPAEKANPQFSAMVTPPKLGLDDIPEPGTPEFAALLDDLYIGDDAMAICAQYWDEVQEFRQSGPAGVRLDDIIPDSADDPKIEDEEGTPKNTSLSFDFD